MKSVGRHLVLVHFKNSGTIAMAVFVFSHVGYGVKGIFFFSLAVFLAVHPL